MADPTSDERSAAEDAEAFRADDASAARVLAERLAPLVAQLVGRLSGWSGDCDDLVQEALVTALTKRKTFDARSTLETWMTRITINCCRAHARKQWLRRQLFRAWAERQRSSPPEVENPEALLEIGERAAAVQAAVARLPQRLREAIVLCCLEGRTAAEAAELLGVRRGTLEVRLSRAKQQLRATLAGKLGECKPTECGMR